MLWRDVVDLITTVQTQNSFGEYVDGTPAKRTVFANKKSIRQSEFYQAHAQGIRPEVMFVVRSIDYDNETRLEYNSQVYFIVRTYSKNDEIVELICSRHPMG
jgi:SPP1 family predicted phage head-tail adaptor